MGFRRCLGQPSETTHAVPLMTPEQYKASLRDGRTVYGGEKVADVTTHPVIGIAVGHAAIDYRWAHDPAEAPVGPHAPLITPSQDQPRWDCS